MGWIIDLADGDGGISQRVIVPPDSPFADAAAVSSFYNDQANRDQWLRNSTGDDPQVTVIVVEDNTGFPDASAGVNTYQWGGIDQATSYDISNWVIYQGLNATEIKQLYESNADTNAFTDAEKTKLANLSIIARATITANTTAALNTAYTVDLTSPVTLTLPGGASVSDIVRVDALINIGSNTLTVDGGSPNSINVQRTNGTVEQDQTVTTIQSRVLTFIWTSGGWFIYDF